MDGCKGAFTIDLTGSSSLEALLFIRTTNDQEFKYFECYKNIVPMALAATVGSVCGVTIIGSVDFVHQVVKFFSVGAISIYLFDRYLKKKEVREHEKQVLEYNKFETNPMLATEQTSHTPYPTTSPDQTSRQTSGRLEATQHEPNTTQSNSFYMQDNQ